MFANLNAETFKIDTLVPALQTATILGLNEAAGRLGYHYVSTPAVTLVGSVAALVTAVSRNLFDNPLARYASTAVGVFAGMGAYRFFYPSVQSFDPKAALAIGATLFVIQACADIAHRKKIRVSEAFTA